MSFSARRRYGKAACTTILIDCAKLGGPLNQKPYRNLHLGTTGDKNELRIRFDSLQLDVPTILLKRTHSTSSITNSCNSDDNIVGVEHSTESVTSTGNVFCIKTVFALSKLSIKNCQGYVVECHAEIKRQSDVIAQLNVDKELLAKQQIENLLNSPSLSTI